MKTKKETRYCLKHTPTDKYVFLKAAQKIDPEQGVFYLELWDDFEGCLCYATKNFFQYILNGYARWSSMCEQLQLTGLPRKEDFEVLPVKITYKHEC